MFRDDFVWGVASSAYQIEGRDPQDGAGKCIWDTFAEEGRVYGHQNADVACDHIHRYKEDFAMMRLLGIKAYRFSLSWARLMPEGTGAVNEKAVALYRDYPYTDKPEDVEAAKSIYFGFDQPIENWTWNVAWFADPVFLGTYPAEGLEKYRAYLPEITEADMELIHQPIDFMGQNIYNGYYIRRGADGRPEYVDRPAGFPKTAANWPVTPECLYWGPKFLYERYHMPLYITENGMSCHDIVSADGQVHDSNRIEFLDRYLSQLQKAGDEGADIRGYFLWTFLDNFEWDKGYNERFGIVYVDFATQKRTAKDSAYWYQRVIETNGGILSMNDTNAANAAKEILWMKPVFKQMIWGGNKLGSKWGYEIPGENTGECWAVSAHPNGDCTIKEGTFAGKTLSQLWSEEPQLFGNAAGDRFPLLIKIIDANDDLSIQVHPDDTYAGKNENGSFGKTECWYILDAPEDATLVIGHNAKDRAELEDMIGSGRWEDFLREVPVKKGDFIQIDPGTVHAIKGGIEILETQQNSDITYRVYDYGRLQDGKPRELHIEKSIDVITVPAKSVKESVINIATDAKNTMNELISCNYYRVWKLDVDGSMEISQEYPFLIMSVVEGDGLINGQLIKKGDHFILPNGFGKAQLQGKMALIASTIA
ncbi:MAG: family 1 glycosylhydrolase [Lachnospiraceae bacterium]|nr:family 1 glycosylhydrolase [Lachnospiraceae bacterium]